MDSQPNLAAGDAVELECAGNTARGTLLLVSPNRESLMVELPDGLRTPHGVFANMVPLLMQDGRYCELVTGLQVTVRAINETDNGAQ